MPVINLIPFPAVAGAAGFGPCDPWELLCADFPEGTTPELETTAAMIATEILWNRTKRQFGTCSVELRPCRKECFPAWPWIPSNGWTNLTGMTSPFPARVAGNWITIPGAPSTSGCRGPRVPRVGLPYL